MPELPKAYQPSEHEAAMYKRWESSGYFNPDNLPNAKKRKPFSIAMPPPNITGELHMGHALGMTLEDIMIRYQRMQGRSALWLPGTDHAAIATQVLVERELRSEGIDRKRLGREKFLERVWLWKAKYGGRIVEQIKRLGASADWSRERFTMDDGLTLAVQTAFKKLYDDGLIYRGERMINWCWECGTAISDLEVEHQDTPGKLWYLRYPVVDSQQSLVVATTRPETLLGDTAVAVNPDDERYAQLIGKRVRLPIANREIPIIADARIDQAFGTGAVKVTPAHDPLDFELGQTHQLPRLQVIGFDGKMTPEAGPGWAGLSIGKAREQVLTKLRELGALEREQDYIHAVGTCSRSRTPVEPLVSRQWFLRMAGLAKPAMRAVRSGKVKIVPERYTKTFFHWMEHIRDWNISRQIWWGHRLPVWYQRADVRHENPTVALQRPGPSWVQEEDTLDTWFSSGLWTFSTLGWPKKTKDLERFHPTAVMETGWDILFFWVARMMMLSLYFMKEVPFKTIYLHGLVLDDQGRKMSKSKGTGIDPLPLADRYGMDALRMSLIVGNAPGQDFRLFEKKIEGYRNFANKLWNIGRFIIQQPGAAKPRTPSLADNWIVWKLGQLVTEVTAAIDRYDFSLAGQRLYDFVWHDFADWYLEASKVHPNPAMLRTVFEIVLPLLHPFMPFITERLWQALGKPALVMVSPWPKPPAAWKRQRAAGQAFEQLRATVVALRHFKLHSQLPANTAAACAGQIDEELIRALTGIHVRCQPRLEIVGGYREIVLGTSRFQFPIEYIDRFERWRQKERTSLEHYRDRLKTKLSNQAFVKHAPSELVKAEQQKLAETEQRLLEL